MLEPSERPPIAQAPLSVVLLAAARADVAPAVAAWRAHLDTLGRVFETLVAEATDAGIGPTLHAAFQSAQYPLLLLTTADGQFRPDEVGRLLAAIDPVDIVVGCRVGRAIPWWRSVLDRGLGVASRVVLGLPLAPRLCWLGADGRRRRRVARWVFGVRLHDPECPLRLMRRAAVAHLPLQSRGTFALVEMLAKANHLEAIMTEEPVAWSPPPATADPSFGEDAWRLFRNPDFGRPPAPTVTPPSSSNAETQESGPAPGSGSENLLA
jgi:hypothetical protein